MTISITRNLMEANTEPLMYVYVNVIDKRKIVKISVNIIIFYTSILNKLLMFLQSLFLRKINFL